MWPRGFIAPEKGRPWGCFGCVLFTQPHCHSFTCCIKIMLLIAHASLRLSLPFLFNLGFGSYKHALLSTAPFADAILVHAGAHSVSQCQKKIVGFTAHHLLFALCFPRVQGLPSNNHMQADKWEYNQLSMKRKKRPIYLSVVSLYGPLSKSGPIEGIVTTIKNVGGFQRDSRGERCFKAVTERPSKHLGSSSSWRLLLQGDPDLEPPQPRTS